MAWPYRRPYAPGVAHADDDIARLLRRMVDTMDRSTGEASRQVVAFVRTLGIIDDLLGQVDRLGSEVALLNERVRTLEKSGRKQREKKKKKRK